MSVNVSTSNPVFNSFLNLPYVPYNIISHLAQDPNAENFWNMLYYNTSDCLSQQNLTLSEKLDLIWKGDNGKPQLDCNIFLTNQVEDFQTEARTYMKVYKIDTLPKTSTVAMTAYVIELLFGGKIAMVEYNGIPCNRADLLEMEILKSLNGINVGGVGYFQFNTQTSNLCRAKFNVGNNTNYTGVSIIMATGMSTLVDNSCEL